jgi:phage regulator Rha-like protein
MLDECYGLLINTKRSNREIENEIKNQAPMLKDLENQMDTVEGRMKRAKEKLNQYVEKSSNSCLLTTMCLMIVLMLILILS